MNTPQHLWFVWRSPHAGALAKRVRRLAAPSLLTWFQWQVDDARTSLTPRDVARGELGGALPFLAPLFEAVKVETLHTPKSIVALRKLLRDRVPVANADDDILLDDHTLRLRVRAADGEPEYVTWFDSHAATEHPERFAFLLREEATLPEGESEGAFSLTVEVPLLALQAGEGQTYACVFPLGQESRRTSKAVCFGGARLGDLGRALQAQGQETEGWAAEWRLLQALATEDDGSMLKALRGATTFCAGCVSADSIGLPHALATAFAPPSSNEPVEPTVSEGLHHAMVTSQSGSEQWILFDDRWAAAHPDLATSILRTALSWDPCAALKAPKLPREAKPKDPKAKAPKPPQEPKPKGPKPPTKAQKAAHAAAGVAHRKAYETALAGRIEAEARPYKPSDRFDPGELISHPKFGLGWVREVSLTKVEVLFPDAPRMLVHGVRDPK